MAVEEDASPTKPTTLPVLRSRLVASVKHSDFACFRYDWCRAPLKSRQGTTEDLGISIFREIVEAFDSKLHRVLCTGYILGVNAEDSTAVPAASTYLLPAKSGLVLSELRSLCSMCKLVRNDQRVCISTQEANVSPLRKTLQHETYYYNDVMKHLFNEYPHAEVGLSRRRREPRDPVAAREIVALLLTDRTTDRDASHMQFIYQLLPVVANMIDLVGPVQTFSSRLMPAAPSCDAAERLMHATFVFDCPKLFRYICMHTATPIHRGVCDWPSLLYALLEQPDAQAYLSPLLTKMCRDEVALRVIDRISSSDETKQPLLINSAECQLRAIGPATLDRITTLFGHRTAAIVRQRKNRSS